MPVQITPEIVPTLCLHIYAEQIAFDWTGEAYYFGQCIFCNEKDM